jgi:hypothetical protein
VKTKLKLSLRDKPTVALADSSFGSLESTIISIKKATRFEFTELSIGRSQSISKRHQQNSPTCFGQYRH